MNDAMRHVTVTATTTLETEVCCNCGILFAMPAEFRQQALKDRGPGGRVFYCPAGHKQWYVGETPEQRAEALSRRLDAAQAQLTHERDQRAAAERSARALRAVNTRTRRRIAAGVCPCCRRSFSNLAEHMAGQHPDYAEGTPA